MRCGDDNRAITVSRPRRSRGFTLIEIMIAIFLLVVAMLGVISVTVMVIKGNSFSKTMTTATTLAADKMEELKNTAYASVVSGNDTQETLYTRTWVVTNNSPATGMKTVVVTVAWNWQGNNHDVVLRSIVSE
ncbi:MAG: prepilin-type N-terminal cleavage/methylation domain-containing protein [Syntrophales bacterium]|nr:prepilin-type N-terminal cleavage/methylation domain-containing protein [Syntrophales bacterium]HOG08693.1 prepilin-type N-terminal cleavage/methylation domain-containing protein [Syntrophales bacterium]HOS77417.1 prepilin-type N-terminal cleavage/methylation domain-containing protein [Syntrophales bacterium]